MSKQSKRTILIVGAAGGVGRAVAEACAHAGDNLSLCDAGVEPDGSGGDPNVVSQLAEQLRQVAAGEVLADARSITAPGAVPGLVADTVARFGALDGVVWCAGVQRERALLRTTDTDFEHVLQVQVLAAMSMCRDAARVMAERGGGSMVIVTGSAAMFGTQRQSAQGAASAAMAGFCRGAALDLRRHGVRINVVAALAKTRVTEHLPMFQNIQTQSMTAEQVAHTVVFLLDDQRASHVSGEIVGAAGSRIYGIRTRETPGHFFEGDFTSDDVAQAFTAATRP